MENIENFDDKSDVYSFAEKIKEKNIETPELLKEKQYLEDALGSLSTDESAARACFRLSHFIDKYLTNEPVRGRFPFLFIKVTLDDIFLNPEYEVGNDLGHRLGHALIRFDNAKYHNLTNINTMPEVKFVMEFMGQYFEAFGKFESAYDLYKESFPEKYSSKLGNENDFSNFKKRNFKGSDGRTDLALIDGFNKEVVKVWIPRLKENIKDSELMKIDAKANLQELIEKCIASIDVVLKKE